MLYDVRLTISYAYDSLTLLGRHLLRIMPADLPGRQRLVSATLLIDPLPDERMAFEDFWGNGVVDLAFRTAQTEVTFGLSARVERLDSPPALDLSIDVASLESVLRQVETLGRESPHHFLSASPRVPLSAATRAYAAAHMRPGMTVAQAVVAIGHALHADMRFDPEATNVDTPLVEAFSQRRGVCQDFTHIMIACLRGLGIPAGYVSGYLRTNPPPGQERLEGADAMHAWVRAWCGPGSGWIEFDPTNATLAGVDHLVVAGGRDYGDVAPVRGVLRTAGSQKSTQAVDVVPLA